MKLFIMVFNNTHEAMAGEKAMQENNINAIVMPTPTYITKSCGICLRFDENSINAVDNLIDEEKIKFKNIYFKDEEGFKIYK